MLTTYRLKRFGGMTLGVLILCGCAGSPETELGAPDGSAGDLQPTAAAMPEPETTAPDPRTADVWLRVAADAPLDQDLDSYLQQMGSLPVTVAVSALQNGSVTATEGPSGGLAMDFPEFVAGETYPRAVVSVTAVEQDPDPLAPGDTDFRFGILFRLDETSSGSDVDNGDNLIQRGMASDPAQFKLEIDGGRARCQVIGSAGSVEVRSSGELVDRQTWYQVECERQGDSLTLTLTPLSDGGDAAQSVVTTATGPIGTLMWEKVETPLAVGGKLAANGHVIRSATDQFNGQLAEPFVEIGRP